MKKSDRKNSWRDRRGFSLLELLMVMVILTIVGAIAYGAFQRMAINANLKTAARDIASDFALLKQRAMAELRMYRLVINVAGNSYSLQQCDTFGSPCSSGWTPIQGKNLSSYAPDLYFDGDETSVTDYYFQTRGTANMGTIVLRNGRNSDARITINATGRTNVAFNMQ